MQLVSAKFSLQSMCCPFSLALALPPSSPLTPCIRRGRPPQGCSWMPQSNAHVASSYSAPRAGKDTRIGKRFLNASVGFGGSCFQKVRGLAPGLTSVSCSLERRHGAALRSA